MNNKRNLIILGSLIVIWILSYFVSDKGTKKNIAIEKYEYKSKTETNEVLPKESFYNWLEKKNSISNNFKRNIFEKYEPKSTVFEEKKEEKRNLKEKKIEQQKESTAVSEIEIKQEEPIKYDEVQLITNEMYNIQVQGMFKNKKTKIVFLKYKGNDYEIRGEGSIKISTETREYEIKAYFYEEEYITFYESINNITIKKRVKE